METAGLFPVPRTMGSFVILITILAFFAGILRNELTLILLGTVFLAILVYSYLGVFLLGLLHHLSIRTLSLVISPEAVPAGSEGELYVRTGSPAAEYIRPDGSTTGKIRLFRLPAILVRCELCLETADGRVIRHYINPGVGKYSRFPVKERGAYFGKHDSFVVFDALGFFRLSLPIRQNEGARLLSLPHPREEHISLSVRSGGTEQRNDPNYRKSDELTDHRPYVPGDDPRRINWKLYGHAPMGELFVREGESRPPPHSRLLILLDTEADSSLYTPDEARHAVDLLCETALAAALDFSTRGMDIFIGCTSCCPSLAGNDQNNSLDNTPLNTADFAQALAHPYAVIRKADADLPKAELPKTPRDRAVLIIALPRTLSQTPPRTTSQIQPDSSALDRFLKKREAGQELDIIFLYGAQSRRAGELEACAGICVNFYNGKQGIYAKKLAVAGRKEEMQ